MKYRSVNETLIRLIEEEPLEELTVLDVGCGGGALTFIVAQKAKRVVGIDISPQEIEKAKKEAKSGKVSFLVRDAESIDYAGIGKFDIIVSHLCMSDEIIENSYKALPRNGVFAFACFHSEHLIEGGKRSKFSYTLDEMRNVLVKTGFRIDYLEVEREELRFQSADEALEILGPTATRRWREDGRLKNLLKYIQDGGERLTKSLLVGKARKIQASK
jgi:2-polyprenyl-3-methyl-5-hydroxy-6-metoxy-1,4-benzoquinol methylase